ncbi:MAG: hypothetical protein ACOYBO_11270, partial [Azonexus sp.]
GFRRPAPERAVALAKGLHQRRILTKLRNSAGQDIDGGCGQLRARSTLSTGPKGALPISPLRSVALSRPVESGTAK